MHSTLLNLIKTNIAENNREWDDNIKIINFTINTTPNQTTKFTPYELTFGRNPNVPSTLRISTNLTHQDLITKWKKNAKIL